MGIIPQELLSFKSSVSSGSISSMKSSISILADKTNDVVSSLNSLKSGISSYYNSKNKDSIISNVSNISSMYSSLSSSISGDLKSMVDKAGELVSVIEELESLDESIKKQEVKVREEKSKDQGNVNNEDFLLNSLNSQFDTKKETALKIYESLKSMDSTIEFEASTSSRTSMSVPKVTGGSFVERTFTYNRYNIKYYLYVPDVQDTTGLSVNMYLNGTGEMGNVLKRGLPKQLANKVVTPSSLVICTETRNEQLYYDDGYRDALVELTKEVVKEFNTDPNKVSLSGHSSGAILAYNLVKRYPGYFSAIVPISGGEYLKPEDTSLFSGVNVWAFHGDRDPHTMRANYNNVINKTIKPLKENGVDVQLTTLEGEGHNIQDEIFTKDYKDEYGNIINPLEWAFQQTRRA